MKINIHETLMNLNRGRISVDQAHDEIESAMCEANVQPQLYEVRTDGICFICKKPTQNLSPDPTNWRIDLPFNGGDGLTRQYHQGCLVALIDKHFV